MLPTQKNYTSLIDMLIRPGGCISQVQQSHRSFGKGILLQEMKAINSCLYYGDCLAYLISLSKDALFVEQP